MATVNRRYQTRQQVGGYNPPFSYGVNPQAAQGTTSGSSGTVRPPASSSGSAAPPARPGAGNNNSTSDVLRPPGYGNQGSGNTGSTSSQGRPSQGQGTPSQSGNPSGQGTPSPQPGSSGGRPPINSGGGVAPPASGGPQNSGPGYDSLGHPAYGDFAMGGGNNNGGGGGGGGNSAAAAPANPLGLTQPATNPFTQMPWFSGQNPDWWSNTGHVAAANAWNGAMLPWYEWANNAANSQNTWNNNQWDQTWGGMSDQFGMGMDIANLQANYGQGLNNLDYNTWATGLESSGNSLATMGDLTGSLNSSYNDMYGNMYGADMGYLGEMAQTGQGYAGLQNEWDVANMQALNDWYNNQARNQTDLQVATMQAFGRQQAPNARFMQNWG